MNTEFGPETERLSDRELLERVRLLAREEFKVIGRLMAHLTEMERRSLYLSQGCNALSSYCVEILGFSEYEAVLRAQVARECLKFPVILEMLEQGDLHLTNVRLLIPHLTPENHRDLLKVARGKSKRELERALAAMFPKAEAAQPPANDLFTASQNARSSEPPRTECPADAAPANDSPKGADRERPTRVARQRAKIVPISSDRARIALTASAKMLRTLHRLQNLLSHQTRDDSEIVERALDLLLREVEKKKLAKTDKPRAGRRGKPGSRHIPAEVKREVWARDGGRCAFVGENGHRCTARDFLQWHHVRPHGDGGPATIENIELRCRRHNRYESDLYYGPHYADCEPGPEDLAPSAFESHERERGRRTG